MTTINGFGVIARATEMATAEFVAAKKPDELRSPDLNPLIADKQILKTSDVRILSAAEFGAAINAYQPTEADLVDMQAAPALLNDEVRDDLVFDPGAWEKHANVLVAAIIALNIARVANAQLRGHFSVMAADAAKAQGAAIIESGKASLHSAITAAAVSGAIAGFAMVKTFQGQGLKHADISQNRRNVVDANNIERDLKADLGRDDWDPQTTYPVKTFDDFGRITTVDFKPKGTSLTPDEQKWFEGEILKAQKVGQHSDWLSQMGSKGIEKKLELGRAFNAMSMSLSQVVSNIVRMTEHAAREKEVLQQSAQNTQKSLSDEIGQKDSADAALLQKLMDMVMQLFQSRIDVIGRV
ncbi:cell invasion protein [Pseudomonas sp. C1C7]|uniref:IpaC/SipC family type III secretion system effector n=1 Tax=Pseudomonas sp. C1C7 TaxID=2735272 RepID=UPI0015861817|nr:IpaC/SipC family type III secretion system effector [Pseudomonas sp. C1C7]NUT77289.1 cell invasion protein [Pseudomonas sp. C1C7]